MTEGIIQPGVNTKILSQRTLLSFHLEGPRNPLRRCSSVFKAETRSTEGSATINDTALLSIIVSLKITAFCVLLM